MPNPYIVGTAVSGNRFYGREAMIDKVLTGDRDYFCMMGNRRIGKTSFLRHLEFLVKEEQPNFIGVYWDLQGCQVEADLIEQLKNGLLDAEEKLDEAGIDYDGLEESANLFALLRRLKRGIIRARKKLLLLVDESESLVEIGENDKGLLGKLRSVTQDASFVRTVLCASRRLSEVSQIELAGSDFLDGFEPVLFMSSLTDAHADSLIAQSQTGQGLQVPNEMTTEIKEKTNRHPYLIQSICLYLYDHEMSLPKAYDYVMQQGMAEKAFADDYRYLSPIEKDILMQIHQEGTATLSQIQQKVYLDTDIINQFLFILGACGYVKEADNSFSIANYFFERWLKSNQARLDEIASVVSDAAMQNLETESADGEYTPEAIMVVDICGNTRIANHYGDHLLASLIKQLEDIVLDVIPEFGARYRLSTGDGWLLTFSAIVDAVNASLEIQKRVEAYNAAADEVHHLPLRFSIHFGETLTNAAGRRVGSAVIMTFRVEALRGNPIPEENYILVTEQVSRELTDVPGIHCNELGTFEFAGFTGLHRVYELRSEK